jgi:formylglycine-generating enzyme required for sulfatase activity
MHRFLLDPLLLVALAAELALSGCRSRSGSTTHQTDEAAPIAIAPKGKVLQAAENEDGGSSSARTLRAASAQRVDIPAGPFEAGSTPGDQGRDPVLEPANLAVELAGFSIDRYLYPNDPSKPAMVGVSRARAAELCQRAEGRLCTELEWERACKGPDKTSYAGGAAWDPDCAKAPQTCASGFGVLGLGAAFREWTASDVAPIEKTQPKAAAVRGAQSKASGVDHRCAHRSAVDATVSGDDIGFRCCYGPPNAAVIASPQWEQTFRRVDLTPAQVSEMFASVPQLAKLSEKITFFKEPDDVNVVLNRGDAGTGQVPNTTFTTQPLLWNPVPGEELLIIAGRSERDSFIVAFHRLSGDRYRIGSSLVMENERGPVVLGFNGYVRRKLAWAISWDRPAESGNITYRDDNRVVITQK